MFNEVFYKNLTNMKELVDQIKAEYEVFAKNAEAQVEKGNKAAGARARKFEHHEDDEGFQKSLSRECKINLSQAFYKLRAVH